MALLLNHSLDQVRRSRNAGQSTDRNNGKLRQTNDSWKHDLFENGDTKSPPQPLRTVDAPGDEDVDQGRSTSLLITNLHYDVSEAELEALFSQIGKLDRGPFIKFDQSGRATEGLAFVSYANESHAEAAIEAFNGASAKGQPIGVQYEYGIPLWVRTALGINGRQATAEGVPPTFGLLGRMQQDRPTGRPHFSPYEANRPRGPRSSFPPVGRARAPSNGRDYRRTAETFGSGIRARAGPAHRHSGRPRWTGDRPAARSGAGGVKSARELDKELEAFMGSSASVAAGGGAAVGSTTQTDVQMTE